MMALHGSAAPTGHLDQSSPATDVANEEIRVLVAEDDETLREALADLIRRDKQLRLVGVAADADEAIELALLHRPDVALVDVKMPAGGGQRVAQEIQACSLRTRVVAYSAYADRRTVMEMLRAGAVGYLVKDMGGKDVLEAIHLAARGQSALSVEVTADVIRELVTLLHRSEGMARELRELDRTKSELMQVLSEELSEPVAVIQEYTSKLTRSHADPPVAEHADLTAGVERASTRLTGLVGTLSIAALLDRSGVQLSARPVAAAAILSKVSQEFRWSRQRVRIPMPQPHLTLEVWADVDLAARALAAVVENALRYSPDSGVVEVEVQLVPAGLEFRVLDRGPGIESDLMDKIFQPFAGPASPVPPDGKRPIGIGLYLARRVLTAHGGKIWVEPRLGGGSIFVLSFPAPMPNETLA